LKNKTVALIRNQNFGLGFPAFALEVFALYVWAASALNLPRDPELADGQEDGIGLGLRESEEGSM